ncbi:hypothetical protein QQF64_013139, partial [Cirrhinus molitorella]
MRQNLQIITDGVETEPLEVPPTRSLMQPETSRRVPLLSDSIAQRLPDLDKSGRRDLGPEKGIHELIFWTHSPVDCDHSV